MFILDTKEKIFQFNGANSNIQERAKALEVIQFLKDKYHEGTCDVAIVGEYCLGFVLPLHSFYYFTFASLSYDKIWHSTTVSDDGKLQTESDSGAFWVLFGGFAPIGKKVATEDDIVLEKSPGKLFRYLSCSLLSSMAMCSSYSEYWHMLIKLL